MAKPQWLLMRHGTSKGQVDHTAYTTYGDKNVPLVNGGHMQAKAGGAAIAKFLEDARDQRIRDGDFRKIKVMVISSAHLRAMQTAEHVHEALGAQVYHREAIAALGEIDMGDWNGIPRPERPIRDPENFAEFEQMCRDGLRYYYRYPNGESLQDVERRMRPELRRMEKLAEELGCDYVIMVAHCYSNLVAEKNLTNAPASCMNNIKYPDNCSVIHIKDGVSQGYIYGSSTKIPNGYNIDVKAGAGDKPKKPAP